MDSKPMNARTYLSRPARARRTEMNEWKMVPVEPSDEMVDAVMRHAGWHIEPEEAVTLDGVKVGGISEQEAVSLNAEIAKWYRREWAAWLAASPPAPVPAVPPGDVLAKIAKAMKRKLATARAKGRGGWQNDEPGMQRRLSDMLRAHVEKGDPVDVANFCMFLDQRGEPIASAAQAEPGENAIKTAFFGTEQQWYAEPGSWFIEGYKAALRAPGQQRQGESR